jgi:hypothetical protein
MWFIIETDGNNMNENAIQAINESKDMIFDIIERVVTTPIVASACSNMFPVFIEAILQKLMTISHEYKIKFIERIINFA